MLPKVNSLKKKKDFEKVFKEGQSFKESFLYLKIKKNNLKSSRFGFVVSKKISKKATIRNKIKRRLREITRIKLPFIKKGIDGVIIVASGFEVNPVRDYNDGEKTQRKKISNGVNNFWEIEEIINTLFEKAGIIKNS